MSDFEFMTYEVAAERLKIAVASVKRQAARRKWPKRQGNDGRVTVGIPVSRLSDDSHPDSQSDTVTPNGQPLTNTELLIQSLRDLIKAEKLIADAANQRADTAERRADAAESDRNAWREMAQRSWWRRLVG
jgi:hypothetical protein